MQPGKGLWVGAGGKDRPCDCLELSALQACMLRGSTCCFHFPGVCQTRRISPRAARAAAIPAVFLVLLHLIRDLLDRLEQQSLAGASALTALGREMSVTSKLAARRGVLCADLRG